MKFSALKQYRCPLTGLELRAEIERHESGNLLDGVLKTDNGHSYPLHNGVVDFTAGRDLGVIDSRARASYDAVAGDIYDNAMQWMWKAFLQDESKVRSTIIDALDIQPNQRVLEIGCGSGADSALIAERMEGGELYLQDISTEMLRLCQTKLSSRFESKLEFSCSLGAPLPFTDGCFDRVFHFGGINMFSDIAGTFNEIARVTKVGGKVVVGDESMAPWLRKTDYGRIVTNNNPLYDSAVPLEQLPSSARDVSLRYIVANTFYLISFSIGDGPPPVDLDLPHKGRRGGTMRTRYFGKLEGVSLEAKKLALAAAEASGQSMHDWLDEAVRAKAMAKLSKCD